MLRNRVPVVVAACAVAVAAAGPADAGLVEEAKLTLSLPATGDECGRSVAVSGDGATVVVGSIEKETVYVYTRSGGTWVQLQVIVSPAGVGVDQNFGTSVALGGSYLLVGAPSADTGAVDAGVVYAYAHSGTLFVEVTPSPAIASTVPSASALFGYALSCSSTGDVVAVGAPGGAGGAGTVEVHQRTALGAFEYSQSFPGEAVASYAGFSVAMDSAASTLVVGAPNYANGGTQRGKGYVYVRGVSGFSGTFKSLLPTDPEDNAHFGAAVAVSGDGVAVVVGAPDFDGAGTDLGAAYVFTYASGTDTWPQTQKIVPHLPVTNAGLGAAVAASSARLAAGAPKRLAYAGSVSVYVPGASAWELEKEHIASDALVGDTLGLLIAMTPDGRTLVASAPLADIGLSSTSTDAGAVYVFSEPAASAADDGGCAPGGWDVSPLTWAALAAALAIGTMRRRSCDVAGHQRA